MYLRSSLTGAFGALCFFVLLSRQALELHMLALGKLDCTVRIGSGHETPHRSTCVNQSRAGTGPDG